MVTAPDGWEAISPLLTAGQASSATRRVELFVVPILQSQAGQPTTTDGLAAL